MIGADEAVSRAAEVGVAHELLTPQALQSAMLAKSGEVDTAIESYREAVRTHVEADKSRRVAFNTALLGIEAKTAPERKAKAEQTCDALIYAEEMAEGLRDVAKEALRAKLAQLSALQSMATTIREEMRLAR